MPKFKYKSTNSEGAILEEEMEAPDRFAVYRKIKESGGTVVYVNEVKSKTALSFGRLGTMFSSIKTHEKIIFARNLAAMIQAGLSVTRALSVLEKQTKNKKLKAVLFDLNDDVSKGKSLSDSMKTKPNVFPSLFTSMVKAGEESGNLANSLQVISLQMEKSYNITRKVRGALMYPAVIFSLMIIIGILMLIYMVPTFASTFQGLGIQLPASTRAIISISDFLRFHYLITAVGVIAATLAIIFFRRSARGKRFFDFTSIHFPIFGTVVKEINAARTARTLSSLLSSGVDIVVAIGVTKEVLQNSYYQEVLTQAQTNIEKGEPMSVVFIEHEKLYPMFVGEMMSVGEETGKMSEMLLGVAVFYEDEVDQKTKDMSTLIEPFLMVIMGAAVGFFALAMIAPTYSLVDAI